MFPQTKYLTFISTLIVVLMLFGCGTEDNVFKPDDTATPGTYTSVEEVMDIIKAHSDTTSRETFPSGILMAPKSGEWIKKKLIHKKHGGEISLKVSGVKDRVVFQVLSESLDARSKKIKMKLFLEVIQDEDDYDDEDDGKLGILYFEFSPSGTQFDPYSLLNIPFELLMTDDVDTFVVTDENGKEIDGCSYDIDEENELLITYIPHFSYYYYRRR